MAYKLLSHLYYEDKQAYKSLYEQRLQSEHTTMLNFEINGYDTFFNMCPEVYKLWMSILSWDKKVALICAELPDEALNQFAQRCLIDEIIITNDIEGIYSTRKEISGILKDLEQKNKKKRFFGLVSKYVMLNRGEISLKSCTEIRKIYNELVLPEVVEDDPTNEPDGVIFRKDMALVETSTQKVIHKGAYPEKKIIELMEKALEILNDKEIPALIRISLFHYMFGYIHPFYDGNGRTSRFISSYLLSEEFEYLIGYRLSYTIKENISRYYEAFKICNDEKNCGDLTPFIIMFLNIIDESFENLYEALDKRKTALESYKNKLQERSDLSDAILNWFCYNLLLASLFSNKGLSKKELGELYGISPSTVDNRLDTVRKAGILKEEKGSREKLYSLDLEKL